MTKRTMQSKKTARKRKSYWLHGDEPSHAFEDGGQYCDICGEPIDIVDVVEGEFICQACRELLASFVIDDDINDL